MGRLESQFKRLYWPPLVKETVTSKEYPGYRYEFFSGFTELNKYFTNLCGPDWHNQEWAIYWRTQHQETKDDDRRDYKFDKEQRVTPLNNTGSRRDMKSIRAHCADIYAENPQISSYGLARQLLAKHDITLSQKMAWIILKKFRSADG